MERPPADPTKLLASWNDGEQGESTPGRVMADLKTGGLRDVLEHLATQDDGSPAALLTTWMGWEKGVTPPAQVIDGLRTDGLPVLLERLSAEAALVAPAEA